MVQCHARDLRVTSSMGIKSDEESRKSEEGVSKWQYFCFNYTTFIE